MSCISKKVYVEIEFEFEESERKTLVQAYEIMKNIAHDMSEEELEDTEEAFVVLEVRDSLEAFLRHINVNLED